MKRTPTKAGGALGPKHLAPTYAQASLSVHEQAVLGGASEGIVLRGGRGLKSARKLRRSGFEGRILIDPARYEEAVVGQVEAEQQSLLGDVSPWLERQAAVGVDAHLTPSGYVPDADLRALQLALDEGMEFAKAARDANHQAPVIVVLALSRRWLVEHTRDLIEALKSVNHPVALVLADPNDPLGTRGAVRGFVEVVREVRQVAVLRSDLSALGALAYGALFAAVGTSTSTRHLVPPGQRAGGGRGDESPRLLVVRAGLYLNGSTVERIHDDRGILLCHCGVCEGQSLTRFGDPRLKSEARLHSILTLQELRRDLFDGDPATWITSWKKYCDRALVTIDELERRSGIPLGRPGFLKAWRDV